MSSDPEQEYFSDGISEELLNLLAKIPELRVISRSSSFAFKGEKTDIPTVAKKLNVAYVLEGSVRKAGNQVRITAQLIEARTDTHLWSETYDRELKNIFDVQDEISEAIVGTLKESLNIQLETAPKTITATNTGAYTAYHKGNFLQGKRTIEDQKAAIDYFRQAISLDPGYAEPLVGMANANLMLAFNMGAIDRDVAIDEATAYLDQALRLNPDLADAHVAKAIIKQVYFFDLVSAELDLKRALVSDPNHITALRRLGTIYGMQGRYVEAMGKYQIIIDHDPLRLPTYSNYSYNALAVGDLYMAEQMVKQALEINSESVFLNFQLARVYMAKANLAEAKVALEREPLPVWKNIGLGMIACMEGDNVTGTSIADELIEQHELFNAAEIYNLCGDAEKAFTLLQQAADTKNGDPALTEMKLSWALTSLRNDPRWHEILKVMGLPI
jgi:TolB-like protein/Flp pilus assembly protein TadD